MISLSAIFKILLTGLASLTIFSQTNGGGSGKYFSDAKVIYANNVDEAKAKLPEGYELATSTPIYDDDNGEDTYLAIKRTEDVNQAVRDIRAMNMIGGWSVNSYSNILNSQKESIQLLVEQVKPALASFRSKYALGEEKSKQGIETGTSFASDILSALYNDDLNMSMLDMFLDASKCTNDNLTTMFMQGHSKAIFAIETALCYSTVSLNDDPSGSFSFEDIEANYGEEDDYIGCDYLNPIPDNELLVMCESLNDLKICLSRFTKSGLADGDGKYFTQNNITQYLESLSFNDSLLFQGAAEIYSYMSAYTYNGGPLVDFVLNFDVDADDFDIDSVKPFILEMSDAQRSTYAYSGFTNLIMAMLNGIKTINYIDGITEFYMNSMVNELKRSLESSKVQQVSIYSGVDRSIFSADGIAFTSEAIRQNSAKGDFKSFRDEKDDALLDSIVKCCFVSYGLLNSASVAGRVNVKNVKVNYQRANKFREVIIDGVFHTTVNYWTSIPYNSETMEEASELSLDVNPIAQIIVDEMTDSLRNSFKFMKYVDIFYAIQVVAISVLLIIKFVREIIGLYEDEKIVYEPIPEVMMSHTYFNDKSCYPNYQNVKSVSGELADVTQAEARSHSQWVSLYYSKDGSTGDPISANSFKVLASNEQALDASGVSRFGEKGIYSLTKFTKNNPQARYLSFSRDSSNSTTASIFGEGNWGLALIGLEVGVVLGTGLAMLAKRIQAKKKEKETE